jgi:hypothetical protein
MKECNLLIYFLRFIKRIVETKREARQTAPKNIARLSDLDDGPPGYKIVNYETLIRNEWAEVYDLCVRGKVPSSWCEAINDNPKISSVAKAKARYV